MATDVSSKSQRYASRQQTSMSLSCSTMSPSTNVTYDRRSFKLNGRPFIILSGAVHYIRHHPSRWSAVFDTFHRAALNTVETYVFWNAHDRGSCDPDFSGRRDLFAFIAAAGRAGLHVILRLGPYVCAEVSYGGFPFRLRDVSAIRFRTWNQPFIDEVATWLRFLARQLHHRQLLAPAGGPVILVQLENEYSMVSEAHGDAGTRYLQWCADLQRELDFGVPGIMCYGAADGVVETINAFYAHKQIPAHRQRHPDQPPVWTECWTGWYDTWGAPHHRRPVEDLAYAVARFFAQGGAGVNYYMWMGGTNFGREAMYLQATSYDYDAPIDEFGRETTKARHLAALHRVLAQTFEKTFHANRESDATETQGVFRWGDTYFVCNDSDHIIDHVDLPCGRYEGVVHEKSVHIVDGTGNCMFDTHNVQQADLVKRTRAPVECTVSEWEQAVEEIPTYESMSTRAGLVEVDSPAEQLSLTGDESDYAWYVCRAKGAGRTRLEFEAADIAYVFVNGNAIGRTEEPPWEDRWRNRWNPYPDGERGTRHEIECCVDGEAELAVLTCSLGLVKGEWQLGGGGLEAEQKGLLTDVKGVTRVGPWRCVGGLEGETSELTWDHGRGPVAPAWYRCEIRVDEVSHGWVLDLGDVGKGLFMVNGHLLGRFWDVVGTRPCNGFLNGSPIVQAASAPTQRFYAVPAWVASPDERVLRVQLFVERDAPVGPLKLLRVS